MKSLFTNLACAAVLVAGGGSACFTPRFESGAPTPDASIPQVEWLLDGRLMVDQHALFNAAASQFTELPGTLGADAVEFSPSGQHVMVWKDNEVRFGLSGGVLGEPLPVDNWLKSPEAKDAAGPTAMDKDTVLSGYWLNEDRVYVHESHPRLGQGCRVLDVEAREWQPVKGDCLRALPWITSLERVAAGWVGVSHETEAGAFALVRYDPDSASPPETAFQISFADKENDVRAYPSRDAAAVQLVSPCALENNPAKPCAHGKQPWRAYTWATDSRALHLVRSDVPPGAHPDPAGTQFVWSKPGAFCIGDPAASKHVRCTAVPRWVSEKGPVKAE